MDKNSSIWGSIIALVKKDLLEEFRTKYAINSLIMFAVVTLVVVSFSLAQSVLSSDMHAALIWIIIFFASMSGLGRSFVKEEERNTALPLRMAAASDVVFLGKFIFNALIMLVLSLLVILMYVVLMSPVVGNMLLLCTIVLLGALCVSGASTILAALVAKAASQASLLPILALPLLMPLLLIAIQASQAAFDGAAFRETMGPLSFLFSYGVVIVVASMLLFEYVWN